MIGYIGAIIVGLTLGLMGGGGSIITVPLLVYVVALSPITATAYSLFVVGTTSLVGSVRNIQQKQVDFKAAVAFAVPAFISVFLTRKYLMPALPDVLFSLGSFQVTRHVFIMVFFAIVMMLASLSMIKNFNFSKNNDADRTFNPPIIILQAIVLGVVTGIVGAGGGFLIVPALVLLVHIPMKRAVATSLLVVAVNSLVGFLGDLETITIDWAFLLAFNAFAIGGIFIGISLNKIVDGKKLKKGFGWFVMVIGIYIVAKELSII
ncbi:UPF0721 transmembrane protein [Neptunitalea chrysea]|uniref:Probable membrane transporter protein n=1 Tax=Neptunitalea chrysea TaxID=1647581 RepID=A0A9W6B2Z6_9FLAO|nr:sulfite exporter TauE/SafE family protein [Neptunitalea chrysea]GLB51513.1 UPF0721 transmembrane protein [Neptunitalea chrysea]